MPDRVLLHELLRTSGTAPPPLRNKVVKQVKLLLLSEQESTMETLCEIALSDDKTWSEVRVTAQQVLIDAVMISDVDGKGPHIAS